MDRDQWTSFGLGILTGAVVGGVVALLLAPKSGRESRELIKEKYGEVRDTVGERIGEVRDTVGGRIGEVRDTVGGKIADVRRTVGEKIAGEAR